jgi:hypothetical protein
MTITAKGLRAVVAAGAIVWGVAPVAAATAVVPPRWKNCTIVNKRFPHGVGKLRAHDRTTGTPVTNFRRSTLLYLRAMHYNRGLDRDKDGIACEKR